MSLYLLERSRHTPTPIILDTDGPAADDGFDRIRCPLCSWRPSKTSQWCCMCGDDIPEPFFEGCGTFWNTFLTRGCCPGCLHQWQWTSCLRCEQASLHDDWYERRNAPR